MFHCIVVGLNCEFITLVDFGFLASRHGTNRGPIFSIDPLSFRTFAAIFCNRGADWLSIGFQ